MLLSVGRAPSPGRPPFRGAGGTFDPQSGQAAPGLFLAELGRPPGRLETAQGWGRRREEVGKGRGLPGRGPQIRRMNRKEAGPQTPGRWQHLCPVGAGPPLLRKGHLPVLGAPCHRRPGAVPQGILLCLKP